MKTAFFNNMSDLILNKKDELKYLILYLDEKYKRDKIFRYLNIWKKNIFGGKIKENIDKIDKRDELKDNIEENEDIKKYIIDFDEEDISKDENNKELNENENQNTEQILQFNDENNILKNNINIKNNMQKDFLKNSEKIKSEDKNEKSKTFAELEEEYRIKYLLSSKYNINENDAQNIITIKESINTAVNNTRNNIQKIDENESSNKNDINNNEKAKIEIQNISNNKIIKNIEPENNKVNNNNNSKDDINNKKYFINNELKIEKVNSKVINNFNIKFETLSQKNNKNNQAKFCMVSNVNEFSFAPVSSSHHNNDKNTNENFETSENLKDLKKNCKSDFNIIYNSGNKEKKDLINNKGKLDIDNLFNERLINEEMIQKFLNDNNNERIFHNNSLRKYASNKAINAYNYKNKNLEKNSDVINKKKHSKSNNNIFKDKSSFDFNKSDDYINKSNFTLKKDNSNFLTINKINNMLEEIFDKDKNTKHGLNILTESNNFNLSYKNDKIRNSLNTISNNNHNNFNKNKIIGIKTKNDTNIKENIKNTKNYFSLLKINLKGNEKKYSLNSINNTEKNTLKNSEKKINYTSNNNSKRSHIPYSKMSFNERLEFFKNKKGSDILKIKSTLFNIENNIYTFYPKTNKTIEKIYFDNRPKSHINKTKYNINVSKGKKKTNYEYLNELYLDHKKRSLRIKKLREENDKEDGISFIPIICKNNRWNKSKKSILKV